MDKNNNNKDKTSYVYYIGLQATTDVHAVHRLYTSTGITPDLLDVVHSYSLSPSLQRWYIIGVQPNDQIAVNPHWERIYDVFNIQHCPNLPYVTLEDIHL